MHFQTDAFLDACLPSGVLLSPFSNVRTVVHQAHRYVKTTNSVDRELTELP
jgi:hypothetical protein